MREGDIGMFVSRHTRPGWLLAARPPRIIWIELEVGVELKVRVGMERPSDGVKMRVACCRLRMAMK